ncbi:hypothetical protein DPMN_182585, partial [Dreissena polymorpha]
RLPCQLRSITQSDALIGSTVYVYETSISNNSAISETDCQRCRTQASNDGIQH